MINSASSVLTHPRQKNPKKYIKDKSNPQKIIIKYVHTIISFDFGETLSDSVELRLITLNLMTFLLGSFTII